MTISEAEFKATVGRFATGVTVVTTCDGGRPAGVTVNAFASLSLRPQLVMVAIDKRSHLHDLVERAGFFAANILSDDQIELSRRFAGQTGDRTDRFRQTPTHEAVTGAPILDEALAYVDCQLVAVYPGGDHSIFVGAVEAVGSRPGDPLLYYRSRYGQFDASADASLASSVQPAPRE